MQNQTEQPIYVLPQNKKRAIIPRLALLLILGTIFYLGLLLNLSLLDLLGNEETTIKTISLIVLIIIVIFGIILSIVKANKPYKFYNNRLMLGKKVILYSAIGNTSPKINAADKMFKTYSIDLSKKFSLKHISQEIDLQSYLKQLISYGRRS